MQLEQESLRWAVPLGLGGLLGGPYSFVLFILFFLRALPNGPLGWMVPGGSMNEPSMLSPGGPLHGPYLVPIVLHPLLQVLSVRTG